MGEAEPALSKVIIVGASSGVGAAIARDLAQQGAVVALLARRADALEALAAELGPTARAYPHDVTRFDDVPALFERIEADLGGVDTLVYAAGVMPPLAEGEYAFDVDRAVIETNLLGAMAWCNAAAARFEAARRGTIVGISSIAGERGRRAHPAYCTSKAALTTYLEALRNRVARYGVNVVTVKPGFVDTAMTHGKKGLFWMVSPERAARTTLALARRGSSPSAFVPARWALVALAVRAIPSFLFRRMNV